MSQDGAPDTDDRRMPLPHPRDLLAAVGRLTVVPLQPPDPQSEAFARATLFFPLIGLLIGAALAGLNWALESRLPQWLVAIILVGIWEALCRSGNTTGRAGTITTAGATATKIASTAAASIV